MQELRIWHITTQFDFESPQKKTQSTMKIYVPFL